LPELTWTSLPELGWTSLPELDPPQLASRLDQLARTTGGLDNPSYDRVSRLITSLGHTALMANARKVNAVTSATAQV
jgi:hypothetical protein